MPIKAAMQALQRTDALKLALATLAAYCASKLPPNMQLVLLEPHDIVYIAPNRIRQTCHVLPDHEALPLMATVLQGIPPLSLRPAQAVTCPDMSQPTTTSAVG